MAQSEQRMGRAAPGPRGEAEFGRVQELTSAAGSPTGPVMSAASGPGAGLCRQQPQLRCTPDTWPEPDRGCVFSEGVTRVISEPKYEG